jgi:hypothetical protein
MKTLLVVLFALRMSTPPETAAEARAQAESARQAQDEALRCIRDAVAENNKNNADNLKALEELARLVSEKGKSIDELRRGYYCSQCGRTATEIESSEHIPFSQHLQNVNGKPVPAGPERILAKAREYDAKIEAVHQRVQGQIDHYNEINGRYLGCQNDRNRAFNDEQRARAYERLREGEERLAKLVKSWGQVGVQEIVFEKKQEEQAKLTRDQELLKQRKDLTDAQARLKEASRLRQQGDAIQCQLDQLRAQRAEADAKLAKDLAAATPSVDPIAQAWEAKDKGKIVEIPKEFVGSILDPKAKPANTSIFDLPDVNAAPPEPAPAGDSLLDRAYDKASSVWTAITEARDRARLSSSEDSVLGSISQAPPPPPPPPEPEPPLGMQEIVDHGYFFVPRDGVGNLLWLHPLTAGYAVYRRTTQLIDATGREIDQFMWSTNGQ